MSDAENQQAPGQGLPLDPLTLLLGLLRRWYLLVAFIVFATVCGMICALKFGSHVWEAETVLLYEPTVVAGSESDEYTIPPLSTQIHMVKLQSNLEEVRARMELAATVKSLGKACRVHVERRTELMFIRCKWDSAQQVATFANTLRNVFIENQVRIRRVEASKQLQELEERLETVQRRLQTAETDLQQFITTHEVIDSDQEIQTSLTQIASLDVLYEQAQVEQKTIELQAQNIDRIRADMQRRVSEEKQQTTAQMEGLANLNIRSERLRKAILDDKEQRVHTAELQFREAEFRRAQELKKKDMISQSEYDKIRAAYERQHALAVDTEQVKEWKTDLEKLHDVVLPSGEDATPSGRILEGIMLRAFDIQLQRVALQERVDHLAIAQERVKKKLASLQQSQRQFTLLRQNVEAREAEKKDIEHVLDKVRHLYKSEAGGFTLISEAKVPQFPAESNRKMIFAGIAFLGSTAGFMLIVLLELHDTTIKSEAELSIKLALPVLGVLPKLGANNDLFPSASDSALSERFKIIARRLRHVIPQKGARILLVSAKPGEGQTLITANLAACFGRQDERVLLIDGHVRPETVQHQVRDLITEDSDTHQGLGEYLSFEADEIQEVIWPTSLPGVECVPRVGEAVTPDLLASNRMHELLEEASEHFNLVLIDGPPVLDYVDAELLAQWSDAVIFVIRSRSCPASTLRKAIDRLQQEGVPIAGAILNGVEPLYFKKEQ